ncbi:pyridoxal 5'-phosphate synthase glutaminase subunit PdxT [Serpentinicella sp. ANB-PHB4]|uniref:pyridoxal 5'-phosphate synthase glutaminase subunit PdxT n=1 Tax=Serpentinicella sp. ANB-PHB4 TaxID=3074076 RepID=UPI0028580F83|nr:pyridoxal 5'-phosphate synthase glutaminase subunit PdxT [Serpentinicella sp. ANB-PHB4]MDR5659316.1 pyridoxal 5'-phosphate synthase glutaminase subunit PdxT [Serpentinicella sp. ANB-PHB4]
MKIGVLSIQGGVIEHIKHIEAVGCEAVEVKKIEQINDIDGLILPGGESTAIGKILRDRDMLAPLKNAIASGLPVWGTCAGMILLAKEVEGENIVHIGSMDITVKRNAYGAQLNSFITKKVIEDVDSKEIPLVFIRAPYITKTGNDVKTLLSIDGQVVAAKQKNMLVTSFHPELTDDITLHNYFINMCK